MRKELALLGLAILAFSLVGCTSVDEEISSTQGTVSSGEMPTAATEMGITEEDLSVSDLDIDLNDDGFSTELII